ncbi:CPBP family intramembrane glutamic endopeptidase [Carboxylicivirga sp. M1479]|uniref:CPBP family intramembrane glutamic endopeptidase n=1 Tax=Carboxylicivirga sp. M1479 TaxID=2594476 RepID=UPI0011786DA8|nr:CPBP family intramembrane glutamic endopeptidase [Carboxylicivirga sp. M1479]TRX72635.1 CPBP family intramembrane metalloprotease [Carboxylicivirga sp. M1479]
MTQGSLSNLPPILKLTLVFTAMLLLGSLSALIMHVVANPLFNVDMQSLASMQSNASFMQTFQILQSICLFVLPSLIAFYYLYNSFQNGISGSNILSFRALVACVGLIILSQAFISYTGWLNHQLELPESMQGICQWMTAKEAEAGELTRNLIRFDNWFQVSITILMMSVLPAIGEEWIFRGILQRELIGFFKNKHLAIVITAIIFSAIHMQFLTFLPRFALGIILGYIFVLSGNLWLSVIAHFTNNFMALMLYMLMAKESSESPFDIPIENPLGAGVIFSFIAIIGCLYVIRLSYLKEPEV